MTKNEIRAWTRQIVEEAYLADPYHTEEIAILVTGSAVFVWGNLSVTQLRELSSRCFSTARLSL